MMRRPWVVAAGIAAAGDFYIRYPDTVRPERVRKFVGDAVRGAE